jgi:hypothetical protein
MNATAVVSCPQCLRQYEIDPATERVVAQCGCCKAHFTVAFSRMAAPAEEVLVLEKEIEFHFEFFQEGCETLAKNICELLGLIGIPINPRSVTRVLNSLPSDREDLGSEAWRKGFLNEMLFRIYRDCIGDAEQRERLSEYFLWRLTNRSYHSLEMLQAAFSGVLGGIPWPEPGPAADKVRPDGSGVRTTPLPPRLRRFSWLGGKG